MAAQSATKEDGLVNQAFKLTVLIGLALAVGVGIYLLYTLTNILDTLSGSFSGGGFFSGLRTNIELVFAPATFIFNSIVGRSGK